MMDTATMRHALSDAKSEQYARKVFRYCTETAKAEGLPGKPALQFHHLLIAVQGGEPIGYAYFTEDCRSDKIDGSLMIKSISTNSKLATHALIAAFVDRGSDMMDIECLRCASNGRR